MEAEAEVEAVTALGVDDVRSPEAPGGFRFTGPAMELEFEIEGGIVGVGGFGGSSWILRSAVAVAVDADGREEEEKEEGCGDAEDSFLASNFAAAEALTAGSLILLDDEAALAVVAEVVVLVPLGRFDVPLVCAYGGVDTALFF